MTRIKSSDLMGYPSIVVRIAHIAQLLTALTMALATLPVDAQDFPSRPLRIIVTTAPGGISDTVFRSAAVPIGKLLGKPVVVDNRPGGASVIGTALLTKSAPDGYTLGMISDTTLVSPLLHKNLPYDVDKDLIPLAPMVEIPFGLIVPSSLPANNIAEFVAYVKAHPGKLNYASIGVGSSYHLAAEMFLAQLKLAMVHVPYSGGSQMLTSLIRTDTSAAFAGVATFLEQTKTGKLKILAVSGEHRLSVLPDVPTFKETGFHEFQPDAQVGIAVPRGTPVAVQRKLLEAVKTAIDDSTYRQTVTAHGMHVPKNISQEAYMDELIVERKQWSVLINKLNISVR